MTNTRLSFIFGCIIGIVLYGSLIFLFVGKIWVGDLRIKDGAILKCENPIAPTNNGYCRDISEPDENTKFWANGFDTTWKMFLTMIVVAIAYTIGRALLG